MKRILAVPCGIGLGHSTRMHSIVNEAGNKAVIRIVAQGLAKHYFARHNYKIGGIYGIRPPCRGNTPNLLTGMMRNVFFPITFLHDLVKLRKIAKDFKPDLLLSDSEPVSVAISEIINIRSAVITNLPATVLECQLGTFSLSNHLMLHYRILRATMYYLMKMADCIIVPSFACYKKSVPKSMHYTDLFVRKRPDDLPSVDSICSRFGLPDDFTLVLLGGADSLVDDPLKAILTGLKKHKSKSIVVGCRGISSPTQVGNALLLPFEKDALYYLKACSRVITLAGHSRLSEVLVFKKPALVIPIRNHLEQMVNALTLKRMNLALVATWNESADSKLKTGVDNLLASEEILKSRLQKAPFRGIGASDALRLTIEM